MIPCSTCTELLWDYLYDLLEPAQASQVDAHVSRCPKCRQALTAARSDCALLASAARLDVDVPAFEAPREDVPAVIPMGARQPRSVPKQRWFRGAAAAAVLFALVVPLGIYRQGLQQRELALVTAESDLRNIQSQRAHLRFELGKEKPRIAGEVGADHLNLKVEGPAYLAANENHLYRVRATSLGTSSNRASEKAAVVARVRDDKGTVLAQKQVAVRVRPATNNLPDDALVSLPPLDLPAGKKVHVEFAADSPAGTELVKQELEVKAPVYLAHLSLEKSAYKPGEVILLRSATLDRSTLKPIRETFTVIYELTRPDGKSVARLSGLTGAQGIGSGALAIPSTLAAGLYRVSVVEADGRFTPASRLVRVQGRDNVVSALANTPEIEFIPEGGGSRSDYPTRIYYRCRTADGRPVPLEGRVLDSKRQEVMTVERLANEDVASLLGPGRGYFDLTPKQNESYFFQMRGSKESDPLYAIKLDVGGPGVLVTNPVTSAGGKIHAMVYVGDRILQQTPSHHVTVGLFSRGRLLTHEVHRLSGGENEIEMTPPANFSGMYRLAIFSTMPGSGFAAPLAQCLGYCRPSFSLPVSWNVTGSGGKRELNVQVGQKGKREPALFAISLLPTDEDLQVPEATPESLKAAIELAEECPRLEDPERLGTLLRNEAASAEALGIYLGSLRLDMPTPARQGRALAANPTPAAIRANDVALLCMDNGPTVTAKYRSALSDRLGMAVAAATRKDNLLKTQEAEAENQARSASADLEAYQARALGFGRMAWITLASAVLLSGLAGLAWAIRGWLRTGIAGNAGLIGAASALTACLALVLMPSWKSPVETSVAAVSSLQDLAQYVADKTGTLPGISTAKLPEHIVALLPVGSPQPVRGEVDRKTVLSPEQRRNAAIWLPHLPCPDGTCVIPLDVPPGKAGYLLRVEAFTESGQVGIASARLK